MPKPNIGQGDGGKTILFGTGKKFFKDDIRFEVLGTLDELNSNIGFVYAMCEHKDVRELLLAIQKHIFIAQANIGFEPQYTKHKPPAFEKSNITFLEKHIRKFEKDLSPLKNFIFPTGTPTAAYFHIIRTITRRLERRLVRLSQQDQYNENIRAYINRLSDVFFVLARFENRQSGQDDIVCVFD